MKNRLTMTAATAALIGFGGIIGVNFLAVSFAQNTQATPVVPQPTPQDTARKITRLEKRIADLQTEVALLKSLPDNPILSSTPQVLPPNARSFNGKTYYFELLGTNQPAN